MNRNRRNQIVKRINISLATALTLTSLAGCSARTSETVENVEKKTTTIVTEQSNSHGLKDEKSETVYVIANPDGSVKKTIVSNWLSNPSELDEIVDYSKLSDIINLKGDETYTVDEDGNIVWSAAGRDIYYQGTSDEELPVGVKITYKLDGEEISPSELAGKSGKLTMTFTYINNISKEVEINGEKEIVYQPFAVISGAMFDNNKVSNISVTNGKAINDGEHTTVVGFALPGLSDSLKLDELENDISIPEAVEITADVTDFSLLTSITVIDNSLIKNITTDETGKLDLSGLSESLSEMTEASTLLVNGSKDLHDGTVTLKEGADNLEAGAAELESGATELKNGAAALESGAKELYNGIKAVDDGTGALDSGAAELKGGVAKLDKGIDDLLAGADKLSAGVAELAEKTSPLPESAAALLNGINSIKAALKSNNYENTGKYGIYEAAYMAAAGCDQVIAGLKSGSTETGNYGIYEGAYAIKNGADAISFGAMSGNQTDPNAFGIYEAANAVEAGLAGVAGQLNTAANSLSAADDASAYYYDVKASETINALLQAGGLTAEQQMALGAALQYIGASEQYETNVASALKNVDTSSAVLALEGIKSGAENISTGAKAISSGAGNIMSGTDKLIAGVGQLKAANQGIYNGIDVMISGNNGNNLNAIIAGVSTLSGSSSQLIAGVNAIKDGAVKLAAGLTTVDQSMPGLVNGTAALSEGTSTLKNGTLQLLNGSAKLSAGASTLNNGMSDLADGTTKLHDGTVALKDGAGELMDGAKTLSEGIAQFDEEAVKKLSKLLDTDISGVYDRFKAVIDFADEYKSYSGSVDESDTGVKFIMRTDAIEK